MQMTGRGTNALLLGVLASKGAVSKRALVRHESVSHTSATTIDQAMHMLRKAGYIEDKVHLTPAGLKALHAAKARAT
jgi:CMP-N-acetylneuraminic acid synthetase